MLRFAKPDNLAFSDIIERKAEKMNLQALIETSPPLSLSTKKMLGSLQESPTHHLHFLLHFLHHLRHYEYELEEGSQMVEGEKHIVKSKAAEACVSIPLLHRIFYFKASHPFL
jgi:hypothetical protein